MELYSISFLFGAVLIGIAVLGGGLEIRELKVPTLGKSTRVSAGLVGVVFTAIGFATWNSTPRKEERPQAAATPSYSTPAPASVQPKGDLGSTTREPVPQQIAFTISSRIYSFGDVQEIQEISRIFIDGIMVADFALDAQTPSQAVAGKVPKRGSYKYMIEGYAVLRIEPNKRIPLRGSGTIDVDTGSAFRTATYVTPSPDMQAWDVVLLPQ